MKQTPIKAKKPMRKVSKKKAARKKTTAYQAALAYMAEVKRLPCIVCGRMGVDAHHCQSGRFGTARASDFDTIPLCPRDHKHEYGEPAYHANKTLWELTHGPDTDYIEKTREAVLMMVPWVKEYIQEEK